MPKKSNFTPRAAEALALAQAEAARFRQPAVAPEHIFLGLLREGAGLGSSLLARENIDVAALQARIEAALPRGDANSAPSGMTPEAKSVMTAAVRVAKELRHGWIGQEHILVALLESPGMVPDVLNETGVTAQLIRDRLAPAGLGGATASRAQIAAHVASLGAAFEGSEMAGGVKRYNLALQRDLFDHVEAVAAREGTTVLEVLRRAVKLALLVDEAQRRGATLLIRDGDRERELILL